MVAAAVSVLGVLAVGGGGGGVCHLCLRRKWRRPWQGMGGDMLQGLSKRRRRLPATKRGKRGKAMGAEEGA